MNLALKTLEEIGQNTSIKQHDSLIKMLDSLNIEEKAIKGIKLNDFVCLLAPAKDDDTDDSDDSDDTDGSED